ncbi:MAG TPA: hypothetical protein VJI71_03140 [Candidatus Norongarragalinales archaeon]|nr:hypothetical protein [Candidatus Norongarragalinales archaeon]
MRSKTALAVIITFLFLAGFSNAEFGQSDIRFQFIPTYPVVNITLISFDPQQVYQGSSTDVSVFLSNVGGTAAETTVNITVYNSTDDAVDVIEFDPITVGSGITLQLTKTYSTSSLEVGDYTANGTGYYDYEGNPYTTNENSTTFEVLEVPSPTPTPQGATGGGGGGEVYLPIPTRIPPVVTPKPGGGLEFSKTTVLREVVAGTSVIESLVLKNQEPKEKRLSLKITKSPSGWLEFRNKELVIPSNGELPVNLRIDVPSNAPPGDYLAQLDAETDTGTSTEFMAIRVKPKTTTPVVTKSISLNRNDRTTIVSIQANNPSDQLIPKVIVEEEIPRSLATDSKKLRFMDKPGTFLEGTPLRVQWEFSDLLPRETSTLSYTIDTQLGEYSTYVYWPIRQVVIPQEITFEQLVRIVELYSPVFSLGEEKEVTARVYNSGLDPLLVKAAFQLPTGFQTSPQEIQRDMPAAGFTNFVFKVKAPQENAGTYIGTFSIQAAQGRIERTTSLIVSTALVSTENTTYLALLIAGIAIAAIVFILSKTKTEQRGVPGEDFDEIQQANRDVYLRQVKGIIKDKGVKKGEKP